MIGSDEQHGQKQSKTPEFANREEEAEFWDTHDFTDDLNELKVIGVKTSDVIDYAVIVRFDLDTFNKLHELAGEHGILIDAMIHTWIVERMKEVAAAGKAQATAPDSRNPAMSSTE